MTLQRSRNLSVPMSPRHNLTEHHRPEDEVPGALGHRYLVAPALPCRALHPGPANAEETQDPRLHEGRMRELTHDIDPDPTPF